MLSFLISAGGFRDFSHEGRCRGGETGPSGNTPFHHTQASREKKMLDKKRERAPAGSLTIHLLSLCTIIYNIYIQYIYISTHKVQRNCPQFSFPPPLFLSFFFSLSLSLFLSPLFLSLFLEINMKIHTLALDSSWHGLMLLPL